MDSLASSNSTGKKRAAASCAEIITIVTEIKTIVAANPENSTVNRTLMFSCSKVTVLMQQVTTLTTKITSVASTVTCSDDEKTSLATSVSNRYSKIDTN